MTGVFLNSVWLWGTGFAQKLGVSVVLKILRFADPRLLFARTRYKRRLAGKLAEMPFLFKDMSLSARDDYVALDVLTAQSGRDVSSRHVRVDFDGPLGKFRAHPRAVIFGNGGYGKTTLFRNLAIRCLDAGPWRKVLGARGALPIYLPLKVVKTSLQFPIMEALQSTDKYFEGRTGLRRIARLAKAGRLVVFLDGYDEMPYTGGFEHVRRELDYIFEGRYEFARSADLREKNVFELSKFDSAYRALR